jgi:predicted metal-dependent hydrolase
MKIIRSRRKTYEIRVLSSGEIEVRVPLRTTNTQVSQLLQDKEAWIKAKQDEVRQQRREAHLFMPGETFLYLGREYSLVLSERAKVPLEYDNIFVLSKDYQKNARQLFEQWYRKRAKAVLQERVNVLAQRNSLSPAKVRISSARTRWGSCSGSGSLSFTWRLVMAPIEVVDYVVIHELAHLIERNHSSKFWEQVERMMPDYRTHREWLKKNGLSLTLD